MNLAKFCFIYAIVLLFSIKKVTEPINIMLREQFLWDELICMSTNHVNNNSNSSTIEKLNNLQTKFTKDDINALRSYAIPVKTAWKWIVDGKLSSLLKVSLSCYVFLICFSIIYDFQDVLFFI